MSRTTRVVANCCVVSSLLSLGGTPPGAQNRPPNIVIIVADDMGYADLGVQGSKDIPTPSIDALAASGIRFTDAYVSGPYCSPTRAGLMTGRYPERFGHEFNFGVQPGLGLPLDEPTIADRLKAAGYRTALFGKWHLGADEQHHPMNRGFDEFFGFLGGAHSYFETPATGPTAIFDGRTPVSVPAYLTDTLTGRAVEFIQRNRERPFLLYVPFNAVHTPMHATDKYLSRVAQISDSTRRTYAAMLSAMDDGVGRIIAALRAERLESNTLIVFFSDNGGPTMPGTTINGSSNAPLRGSKRQTWEGGIRVPFVISWKGHLEAGKVDARPIIQLDVLPTALAAAGLAVLKQWKLDGVNLLPFLTGKRSDPPHEALYWRLGDNLAIRQGNWKLVKTSEGPLRGADPDTLNTLVGAGLYDLSSDLGEQHDLAAQRPDKMKELAEAWRRWNRELAKPLWGPGADRGAGNNRPPRQ